MCGDLLTVQLLQTYDVIIIMCLYGNCHRMVHYQPPSQAHEALHHVCRPG